MPELPEVETVRQGLATWVVGRTIDRVEVAHPRAVRRHASGAEDFAAILRGRKVAGACRRGKYLWLPLDSGDAIVGHLGMSGQMLIKDGGAPDDIHLRIRFTFTDGGPQLRFVDQRTFGGMAVSIGGAELPAEIGRIARDPLDPLFVADDVAARLRGRHTAVKRALLDQTLVSGIGNIYADEALWRAKLHGLRPTDRLTRPAVHNLLRHATDVLTESLRAGGTTFDALYVNVNGESGYFERSLNAYGREGEPCRRCGRPIVRQAFMNRSSFSCPRCQPAPRRRRA
jgi:formamidopyrimidine-DNA glycosylase